MLLHKYFNGKQFSVVYISKFLTRLNCLETSQKEYLPRKNTSTFDDFSLICLDFLVISEKKSQEQQTPPPSYGFSNKEFSKEGEALCILSKILFFPKNSLKFPKPFRRHDDFLLPKKHLNSAFANSIFFSLHCISAHATKNISRKISFQMGSAWHIIGYFQLTTAFA